MNVRQRLRGLFTTPAEGWSALAAVLVMMLVAAAAVDESAWAGQIAGTKTSQTVFLPLDALLATLIGYLLGRSRLGTLRAHALGAVIGGLYLVAAISGAVSNAASISLRLHALATSIGTFIEDVTVRGVRSAETSIFLLLVGALLWGAGQLGAFALFRRHRAGPAITLAASALLINMSITVKDQLVYLIVLVAAALLLVVRTSLYGQLEQWRSRRIADSGYASSLFLRSGVTFVTIAVALSLVLATNASSAPLRPMWDGALDRLVELGVDVNHFLGGISGEAKGPNILFTPSQTIRDQWETSTEPVFRGITADGRGYKWRGATYDFFDGRTWQNVVASSTQIAPFGDLRAPTSDAGFTVGRHSVISLVQSISFGGRTIVAPADPVSIDQNATVETTADRAVLDIKLGQSLDSCPGAATAQTTEDSNCPAGSTYTVTSSVFDRVGAGALTVADLAGAGRNYAAYGDFTPYVHIESNAIGPLTHRVADDIVSKLDPSQRDPYHVAQAMTDYLYTKGHFVYQTDVRGMCTGEILVDCFLREKRGYCEYFATALTMMLRAEQIPARYVVGYLPGRLQADGSRMVNRSASHAWVEAYFPGYGWYPFDPTPGLSDEGQEQDTLPSGSPRPTSQPNQTAEAPNFGGGPPTPRDDNGITQPKPTTNDVASVPPTLAIGIFAAVLLVALGLVLLARRRRLPGSGQLTYDSVARIATRFGYGPAPSQTAYEYADRLAVVVPTVRDDLHVVAAAKVESVYARREPTDDLKLRLLLAYRRVRMSLLRVFLRRPKLFGSTRRR
jgi:transglutaminase-like putative cysteine protease